MQRALIVGLTALSSIHLFSAPAAAQTGISCPQLIADAEARRQIPRGLLMAIAVTESGLNGSPNPHAMNIAGRSYFARDLNDMASVISANWQRGIQSIDVGCMQINLKYHGDKFARMTDLLHSPTNVEYGASYLIHLATERGSWREGVMDYHNKNSAARRRWYGCKVWNNYLRINAARTGYVACGSPPGGSSVASNAGNKVNTSPLTIPGYNRGAAPVVLAQNTIQAGRVTAFQSAVQRPTIGGQPILNATGPVRAQAPVRTASLAASDVPIGSPLDQAPAPAVARGGPEDYAFDVPQPRQRVTGSIDLATPGAQLGDVSTSADARASAFKSVRPTDWSGRVQAEEKQEEAPATSRGIGGFSRAGPGGQ
jgi:hypothetical protein